MGTKQAINIKVFIDNSPGSICSFSKVGLCPLTASTCFSEAEHLTLQSTQTPKQTAQCTEVRFASFLSGGFITAIVVNPPERKLAKRTYVQWAVSKLQNIFLSESWNIKLNFGTFQAEWYKEWHYRAPEL